VSRYFNLLNEEFHSLQCLLIPDEFMAHLLCTQQCSRFYFQMDLMPFINKAGCECLNESDEHGFDNCLRKDSTYLESDCDEQVQ